MSEKKITAAAVTEFLSMVDQYPGLDEYAQAQITPILQEMKTARAYLQQMEKLVASMVMWQDKVLEVVQKSMDASSTKPMTSMFQLSSMMGKMKFQEMRKVMEFFPGYTARVLEDYSTVEEQHQALWQNLSAMIDQIEKAQRAEPAPAAKEAPKKEEAPAPAPTAPSSSSTAPEGVEVVYEQPT
jgi:hypothetical protein